MSATKPQMHGIAFKDRKAKEVQKPTKSENKQSSADLNQENSNLKLSEIM